MVVDGDARPLPASIGIALTRHKELKAGVKKQRIQPLILSSCVLKVLHVTGGIHKVHGFIVVYRL